MVATNHYRWDFIGLSTDTKPTPATSVKVVDGSTYYTSDDSKLYVWYKDQWYEKTVEGGGGGGSVPFKRLTSADYNYPENEPAKIALWLLDEGNYELAPNTVYTASYELDYDHQQITDTFVQVYIKADDTNRGCFAVITTTQSSSHIYYEVKNDGSYLKERVFTPVVINNLTSDSTISALSAYQGQVLRGMIEALDTRVTALGG